MADSTGGPKTGPRLLEEAALQEVTGGVGQPDAADGVATEDGWNMPPHGFLPQPGDSDEVAPEAVPNRRYQS